MRMNKSSLSKEKWCTALNSLNVNTSLKAINNNSPYALVIGCSTVQEAFGKTLKYKTKSHTTTQTDKKELVSVISYTSKPLELKQLVNKNIELSKRAIGQNSKNTNFYSYR